MNFSEASIASIQTFSQQTDVAIENSLQTSSCKKNSNMTETSKLLETFIEENFKDIRNSISGYGNVDNQNDTYDSKDCVKQVAKSLENSTVVSTSNISKNKANGQQLHKSLATVTSSNKAAEPQRNNGRATFTSSSTLIEPQCSNGVGTVTPSSKSVEPLWNNDITVSSANESLEPQWNQLIEPQWNNGVATVTSLNKSIEPQWKKSVSTVTSSNKLIEPQLNNGMATVFSSSKSAEQQWNNGMATVTSANNSVEKHEPLTMTSLSSETQSMSSQWNNYVITSALTTLTTPQWNNDPLSGVNMPSESHWENDIVINNCSSTLSMPYYGQATSSLPTEADTGFQTKTYQELTPVLPLLGHQEHPQDASAYQHPQQTSSYQPYQHQVSDVIYNIHF